MSIDADIGYHLPLPRYELEKPFYSNVPLLGEGASQTNIDSHARKAYKKTIEDMRNDIAAFHMDKQGFQVAKLDCFFNEENFNDPLWIENTYYEAIKKLVFETTGAKSVDIFDHTGNRHPSKVAHVDQTYGSGEKRLELLKRQFDPSFTTHRWQIINVWKPLFGPLNDTPLTLCDWRTVEDKDMIGMDLIYPHYIGEQWIVQHNTNHKWYWLSNQEANECLMLKCYDSQQKGVARYTPHTSFVHPHTPPDARPRESIEIRTLVCY